MILTLLFYSFLQIWLLEKDLGNWTWSCTAHNVLYIKIIYVSLLHRYHDISKQYAKSNGNSTEELELRCVLTSLCFIQSVLKIVCGIDISISSKSISEYKRKLGHIATQSWKLLSWIQVKLYILLRHVIVPMQ